LRTQRSFRGVFFPPGGGDGAVGVAQIRCP
jgi:hypothetical protein